MSSDLTIRYAGPVPFDRFADETRKTLCSVLHWASCPTLIEFSAPNCPSTRPRPQYLGPEEEWYMLGFTETGFLFELGVCQNGRVPEFRVELGAGPPVACAAAIAAATALARLSHAPVADTALCFTNHFELAADRFLEEVQRGKRHDRLLQAAESSLGAQGSAGVECECRPAGPGLGE
ncbi:MAG TPA: hypothetical protein VGI81_25245 [Tepidisphaeraceae bacterium]